MWTGEGGNVEMRSPRVETSFGSKQVDKLNVVNERNEQIRIISLA